MKFKAFQLVLGTLFLLPLMAACPAHAQWVLGRCIYTSPPSAPPPES